MTRSVWRGLGRTIQSWYRAPILLAMVGLLAAGAAGCPDGNGRSDGDANAGDDSSGPVADGDAGASTDSRAHPDSDACSGSGCEMSGENTPCEQLAENEDCPDGDSCSEAGPDAVQSHVLDEQSGARAGYSLRRLRSEYDGPVLRVRRGSDDETEDFGFGDDGWVDADAIASFVGDGDGYVTTWYAQVDGAPDLEQSDPNSQPLVVRDGAVVRDPEGGYALYFDSDRSLAASGFDPAIPLDDYTFWGVVDMLEWKGETEVFGIGSVTDDAYQNALYRFHQSYINTADARFRGEANSIVFSRFDMILMRNDGSRADIWQGNTKHGTTTAQESSALSDSNHRSTVAVGGGFVGTLGEFVVYPHVAEETATSLYESVARDWNVGPTEWNRDAKLPQQYEYQVTLYDWLETLRTEDVTLSRGSLEWDESVLDRDQLADLWIETEGLTASSATRANPEWYVLDAGDGAGIEATDAVRVWDEPKGSGDYGGNPPRSWANEPAFLYQLDLPKSDGSQGNPYYEQEALARRALVIAMVDLMMHHKHWATESSGWYDMFGKAALSWAETYRWTKEVLPEDVREAFETGMGHALDRMIDIGPRAVNTNMDMFAVQAQADFAMATDDPEMECKAVRAARRALFGHEDGSLGDKHDVFAVGDRDGGVFDPSGFIMEGDQPDVFYGGESKYHLAGALAAVTDRETGEVPPEWSFLEEVVRRLQAWRTYQMFYDPGTYSPGVGGKNEATLITAGAGFSGRTSYGVPHGQAGEPWKNLFVASRFPNHAFRAGIPDPGEMKNSIDEKLQYIEGEMSEPYSGTPDEWKGWSPWVKKTPYLPEKGWYTQLREMDENDDPKYEQPPAARSGVEFDKTFGGPPVGDEYWAYKTTDGSDPWGFFLEAQPRQGTYGGWYGGKIETFWTQSTGVVLVNRHGKSGCDDGSEDSVCWDNLDKKAGHHVWGRDEEGDGFTTLLLRGRNLERTSTFETDQSNPEVTVTNIFNDPGLSDGSGADGEQTGDEIEGNFEVENHFQVRSGGLRVTHTVRSDETDEVQSLWASLPVYLRHNNPKRAGTNRQSKLEDTSIEYQKNGSWKPLPEDENGDGTPELVRTDTLRLGRDYKFGDGTQYVYVALESARNVRLSEGTYYDPYQSKTGVRTVHIDIHGDPGTVKRLPGEKSVRYTLRPSPP